MVYIEIFGWINLVTIIFSFVFHAVKKFFLTEENYERFKWATFFDLSIHIGMIIWSILASRDIDIFIKKNATYR